MQSFADDTNLFFSSDNLQYLESVINHELKLIYKYCALNKLSINFAKTNYMLVMVMWVVMDLYTAHIPYGSWRFTTLSLGWDQTSACKGASGSRYQSIYDLTHHIHEGQTTKPGLSSLLFGNSVSGFFNVPRGHFTNKGCETGPTVYRPYLRRLDSLTICRCRCKGSTFFSVI